MLAIIIGHLNTSILDLQFKLWTQHLGSAYSYFPFSATCGLWRPDHNLWVKFAEQVSTLSFPSWRAFNQIEKKQENYNFRLALSLGNISQKRKHKNWEEEFPTRDVGYIHHGNIILESVRAHFKRLCCPQERCTFQMFISL